MCFDSCQVNCSNTVKDLCAADPLCGGFYEWPCFQPGSYVMSLCNKFSMRGAECASKPRTGGGDNWYYYLDPKDNSTWVGGQGKAGVCNGKDVLSNVSGWGSGTCYVSPQVPSDCATRPRPQERLVSIWQPGFNEAMGEEIIAGVESHPNVFNAFSPTWAFWNSPYQPKCNNSYLGTGLCGMNFTEGVWSVVKELNASHSLVPVPIVETCCVCVLNASYDFAPAMQKLVADAVEYGFGGYAVDIECGGVDYDRSRAFFDAFAALMTPLGKTISWWTHYSYGPEQSFPNAANYVYTMDSYVYTTPQFVAPWINEFQCQAGIGLEFPGNHNVADQEAMFDVMANSTTLQAVGVWGYLPNNTANITQVWWDGLKRFREGWAKV